MTRSLPKIFHQCAFFFLVHLESIIYAGDVISETGESQGRCPDVPMSQSPVEVPEVPTLEMPCHDLMLQSRITPSWSSATDKPDELGQGPGSKNNIGRCKRTMGHDWGSFWEIVLGCLIRCWFLMVIWWGWKATFYISWGYLMEYNDMEWHIMVIICHYYWHI